MNELRIKDEFIKLGQALKLAGKADSGLDAKLLIQDKKVLVNGVCEDRRGRKLYDGDTFEIDKESFVIKGQL